MDRESGHRIATTKIERLTQGRTPTVLDLFSGCGGISLGLKAAGFEILGAVELDALAARSHGANFHGSSPVHSKTRDICASDPTDLVHDLGLGAKETAFDVIVGGPPCQAFARVGRAKLREVAEHPEAFRQDPRSSLYLRYIAYIRELRPLAILMENVPDVMNYGGHNIPEEVCEVLAELGYECRYTLLNAVYYGVPEMRERVFLLGYARELRQEIEFPHPTHWISLPRGYQGSRDVAMQGIGLFSPYFIHAPNPNGKQLLPAVTAKQAIGDLPPITLHLEGRLKRGARRFNEPIQYLNGKEVSDYARLMRTWPGYNGSNELFDHVIRYLPRDYPIFRRMHPGDQYPEAHWHARQIFRERLTKLQKDGVEVPEDSDEFRNLYSSIVPPYDPGKFPNKWRKMEGDSPARTLMAHIGKDTYSHIHYDSAQARTISVREAARLQSFPDGFKFEGTMNPAFRQIGNAVPPLLAKAIAERMFAALRGAYGSQNSD
jgi:DNA (cytosine-5)-methyltransferase 1